MDIMYLDRKFWGLDPLFDCYVTLFICDILKLKKYPTGNGAYAYKNHPIHRVDIYGMVVRLHERERYYHVDVDDGTGVISCSCWKQQRSIVSEDEHFEKDKKNDEYKHLFAALKNLNVSGKESRRIQLGDMLHIRGEIGEFRERMEISAPYYRVENDPNVEALRIRDTVHRYKTVYDVPSNSPVSGNRGGEESGLLSETSLVSNLKERIKQYLATEKVISFSLSTLSDVPDLTSIAQQACKDCKEKMTGKTSLSTSPEKHHFKRSVDLLNEEAVCFMSGSNDTDAVFMVVHFCKSLEKAVIDILQKLNNHEGSHYLKVYDNLQRSGEFKNVTGFMVKRCLERLEEQSKAVSVTRVKFAAVLG